MRNRPPKAAGKSGQGLKMQQVVQVSKISIDGGTQPRCEINEEVVAEYAEAMRAGEKFPPIVVFEDGVKFWLADGFHRTHAARQACVEVLDADVRQGTRRDAILFSVGANGDHGQRRTPADKRKAVMTLLTDPLVMEDPETGQPWSDREAARRCKVSHTFVAKIRADIEPVTGNVASEESKQRTYTTKHGTTATMNTANIGKRAEPSPASSPNPIPSINQTPQSRGVGIRMAHDAINILHKIPLSDGLRGEAFDTVIQWIEANR